MNTYTHTRSHARADTYRDAKTPTPSEHIKRSKSVVPSQECQQGSCAVVCLCMNAQVSGCSVALHVQCYMQKSFLNDSSRLLCIFCQKQLPSEPRASSSCMLAAVFWCCLAVARLTAAPSHSLKTKQSQWIQRIIFPGRTICNSVCEELGFPCG